MFQRITQKPISAVRGSRELSEQRRPRRWCRGYSQLLSQL